MSDDYLILDYTSSFRRMWLNKNHPNTIYLDKRSDRQLTADWNAKARQEHRHRPALGFTNRTFQADFTCLPFRDNTFCHVTFDPPQLLSIGKSSIYYKLYGCLEPETWRVVLKQAASELIRVLKPEHTLTLKWNDRDIKPKEVLKLFPANAEPLYGQRSSHGAKSNTYWFEFMKQR